MVVQLEEEDVIELSEDYLWLTLGQLIRFNKFGYLNIEARTLIACLTFLQRDVV